jgi:hypothetical protein
LPSERNGHSTLPGLCWRARGHSPPPKSRPCFLPPPCNKSCAFVKKPRVAIRCSTSLNAPFAIWCLPRPVARCGQRTTHHASRITHHASRHSASKPPLAGERVLHPPARPHPRQRLLLSCQFVKSVSPVHPQSSILNPLQFQLCRLFCSPCARLALPYTTSSSKMRYSEDAPPSPPALLPYEGRSRITHHASRFPRYYSLSPAGGFALSRASQGV